MAEFTTLLAAERGGDAQAAGAAFSLLHQDLRRLARSRLRQHQTMTLLNTTSLVAESCLKLVGAESVPVEDRHHFFAWRCGASQHDGRIGVGFPSFKVQAPKVGALPPGEPPC